MNSKYYLQTIIKASVAEFIFSEVAGFQYILLNTYRRMYLKYENYS